MPRISKVEKEKYACRSVWWKLEQLRKNVPELEQILLKQLQDTLQASFEKQYGKKKEKEIKFPNHGLVCVCDECM